MDFTNGMDYNHTSMVYHDTWVTWQLYCHSKFSRVWGRLSRRCNVTQLESRRLGSSNKMQEHGYFLGVEDDNKWAKKRHLIQKLLKVCTCGYPWDGKPMGPAPNNPAQDASIPFSIETGAGVAENAPHHANGGNVQVMNEQNQQPNVEVEGRGKKKVHFQGRGRRIGAVPKGGGFAQPGWTVAGFDVDGRS
ncbi:hypothetical protein POTOM_042482 [Populus tomentosa]|uniref:Uncharacterized protein n=1 Tax=Populus tomentosa TaxID=118781 RepID=A0A8X7YTQ4_POPTO|nr:hypothetical protein POTOM_042482 [Populus tomentosa]